MGFTITSKREEELDCEGKFFISVVDSKTISRLMSWMSDNIQKGRRDFTLLISSGGGSPSWASYFASYLRSIPQDVRLHGIAIGECGSAALAILQFCHKRSAVRHTGFFPHHMQSKFEINCHQPMEEILAHVEREIMQARSIEEELSLIQSARMGITLEQWYQIADFGEQVTGIKYFTYDALRLGMIDEVIEHYPLIE